MEHKKVTLAYLMKIEKASARSKKEGRGVFQYPSVFSPAFHTSVRCRCCKRNGSPGSIQVFDGALVAVCPTCGGRMLFSAAQAHHKQTVKKGVLAALAVVCCVLALVFFFGDGIRSLLSGGGVQTEASTSAAAAAQSDFEDAAAVPADDANEWQGTTGTKIPVRSVECSSHQPATGKYGRSFGPEMAIDGNFNTCWMVAGEPTPADHWIQLNFWSKQRVAGIRLLNGNGWDGYYNGEKVENDLFGLNGRIREFSVIFNGGSIAMPYTAKDVREESFGENVFRFNTPIETDYIVLQIHTTYPGSKWTTVACLSEIEAFSE